MIFFISPVRSGVSFFGILGILEAKNNFFWPKDPRLDLVEGDRGRSDVLGLSLRKFRHTGHVIHLNDIIKNIIKPHLNIIKRPKFKIQHTSASLDPL